MSKSTTALDVTLLGREYRVACAPEERESLQRAVEFLDARMKDLALKTKSTGERLAVMTALNLAHELLAPRGVPEDASEAGAEATTTGVDGFDSVEYGRRIGAIKARLDAAMVEQEKLF